MNIRIEIGGKPEAKGRGRVGKLADGRATVFTPAHTRKYETRVRDAAYAAMEGRPPLEGAIFLEMKVYLPVPNSMAKKYVALALAGDIRPLTKPDIDNYVKSAMDGLNTIVFKDDNQVVALHAEKLYGAIPRMVIDAHYWATQPATLEDML